MPAGAEHRRGGRIGSAGRVAARRRRAAVRRGPQAGQALGCAWKRRSSGTSYSRWQSAHIRKGAIVVAGRSYGTSRAIVKRGPQLVQLVKG